MIKLKIDCQKIKKELLFKGTKGTYLDISLMDNRDGTDQYGNDGFIVQDVSKEAREAGEKGPIIGNWRNLESRKSAPQQRKAPPKQTQPPKDPDLDAEESDSIPF